VSSRRPTPSCGARSSGLERERGGALVGERVRMTALERALDVRYAGQAYELNVPFARDWRARFHALHAERFGHADATRPLEVVTVRVRARGGGASVPRDPLPRRGSSSRRRAARGMVRRTARRRAGASSRSVARGLARARPCDRLRVQRDDGRAARVARADRAERRPRAGARQMSVDPLGLELANHRLAAIAEEMGVVLGRTALSPNIKERRDYSCAVFDAAGGLVAHAAHIPVHLGSTPLSVRAAMQAVRHGARRRRRAERPVRGGTHLPDVTVVAPVYARGARRPFAFVADRAHHADIGGMEPGSMPVGTDIFQEGVRLPPIKLVAGGRVVDDVLALFLANTRVPHERRGDLDAQCAALRVGAVAARRAGGAGRRHGAARARLPRAAGPRRAPHARAAPPPARGDVSRDGRARRRRHGARNLPIRVAITLRGGRARIDFTGTAPQVRGPVNANLAVTRSAVLYVFAALAGGEVPTNDGIARPLDIVAPEGSLVNARPPAAVAGGNVETSQRIVDVLLRALAKAAPDRVPAASTGSMNNVALGGVTTARVRLLRDARGRRGRRTGRPGRVGHAHAHDEHDEHADRGARGVLSAARAALRAPHGLGRRGRWRGGDGLVRELELLADARVTLLTERRDGRAIRPRGRRPRPAWSQRARARRTRRDVAGEGYARRATGRSAARRDAGRRRLRPPPEVAGRAGARGAPGFVRPPGPSRSTRRDARGSRSASRAG
jgi:N-methylhydantoinase B/oxoprolinase/acetone carboxylase alpha subunit